MLKLHICRIMVSSSTVYVEVLLLTFVNLVVPRGADCKVIFEVIKGVSPELVADTSALAFVDEVATKEREHVIIDCGSIVSLFTAAHAIVDEKTLTSSITKTKIVDILFFFISFSPFSFEINILR